MASWGVVSLVDEPAVLVAAFAAHHLEKGAAEVHIFLDRPDAETADLLGPMAGVSLHLAGADGWAYRDTGQRPKVHTARQKYVASKVLDETRLDWLMHCDADEFLHPTGAVPIAECLDAAPKAMNWMAVDVAERVQMGGKPGPDIFAGAFRQPWRDFGTEGPQVFPPAALDFLHHGISGHHNGKCFARSGRGLFIGVHHGLSDYSGVRDPANAILSGLRLLHFDGLTELHYAVKMLRRALGMKPGEASRHSPARQVQIAAMAGRAGDVQRLHRIWRLVKTLDRRQSDILVAKGVLHDLPHGIAQSLAAHLGREPDLSPAGFDRGLMARDAELLATLQRRFGFDPASLAAA